MTLFFRNCKVLPMTAAAGEPNCFDGYVGVEGRRIALVTADAAAAEAWRAAHAGAREIDGRGGILMPGLESKLFPYSLCVRGCEWHIRPDILSFF